MARFDVFEFGRAWAPFVVDVQANLLSDLNTRVVVPLAPFDKAGRQELPRLKPRLDIGEEAFILLATDIASVSVSDLGEHVANIENEHRDAITRALDFLFHGF